MQSNMMLPVDEPSVSMSYKKKPVISQHDLSVKGFHEQSQKSKPLGKKIYKKELKNRGPTTSQQPERSPSDSLGNEYRALRTKYVLLEEESFGIGKELLEVEDEVKTLEEEKLALLDELIVLEGLVDPSELQSHRLL